MVFFVIHASVVTVSGFHGSFDESSNYVIWSLEVVLGTCVRAHDYRAAGKRGLLFYAKKLALC